MKVFHYGALICAICITQAQDALHQLPSSISHNLTSSQMPIDSPSPPSSALDASLTASSTSTPKPLSSPATTPIDSPSLTSPTSSTPTMPSVYAHKCLACHGALGQVIAPGEKGGLGIAGASKQKIIADLMGIARASLIMAAQKTSCIYKPIALMMKKLKS